jgi:hypothetical protein
VISSHQQLYILIPHSWQIRILWRTSQNGTLFQSPNKTRLSEYTPRHKYSYIYQAASLPARRSKTHDELRCPSERVLLRHGGRPLDSIELKDHVSSILHVPRTTTTNTCDTPSSRPNKKLRWSRIQITIPSCIEDRFTKFVR